MEHKIFFQKLYHVLAYLQNVSEIRKIIKKVAKSAHFVYELCARQTRIE